MDHRLIIFQEFAYFGFFFVFFPLQKMGGGEDPKLMSKIANGCLELAAALDAPSGRKRKRRKRCSRSDGG